MVSIYSGNRINHAILQLLPRQVLRGPHGGFSRGILAGIISILRDMTEEQAHALILEMKQMNIRLRDIALALNSVQARLR
ncbi:hypothetical protein C4568_03815 [Candidatus Parcubacteria bacterium]|nr:MAG: hypothetical protein C4568_03815 [Candidatus Parcubacteria bacterium]